VPVFQGPDSPAPLRTKQDNGIFSNLFEIGLKTGWLILSLRQAQGQDEGRKTNNSKTTLDGSFFSRFLEIDSEEEINHTSDVSAGERSKRVLQSSKPFF